MLDFERVLLFRQADVRRRIAAVTKAKTQLAEGDWVSSDLDFPDWSRLVGLERHASDELESVNRALDRLRHGSFGLCEECGDPISFAALEMRPWLSRCDTCEFEA